MMNKRITCFLIIISILLLSAGCGGQTITELPVSPESTPIVRSASTSTETAPPSETIILEESNILVAYLSFTSNTEEIAEFIAEETHGDLYQITPEIPYTPADLDYNDPSSRSAVENNDPRSRPGISGTLVGIEKYDTVFLGYPIWWGESPKIISTFLESYDFAGKTIVPFCTSSSSGIGSSDISLHSLSPASTKWIQGERFPPNSSKEIVKEWVDGLDIQISSSQHTGVFNFDSRTVLLNSGYEMPILGLGTYSLTDDVCVSSVSEFLSAGGRLIDTAFIYHNEESVGQAIRQSHVPREDIFITTKLYPNQYENGEQAIDQALETLDVEYIDLMLLHHPGANDIDAYKAMEQAVEEGKIRSVGLSNWYVEELSEFLPHIALMPAVVQNEIHPYYQENDVIPFIQGKGIVVQGWYPLGGRGHTTELLNNQVISEIAQAHNKSPAQVILRWNLQKSVIVIPGSSNPEHIRENLDIFDFTLTEEEMSRINELDRNEKHDWY